MRRYRLVGLAKLLLAHHPLCWPYKHHTIQIGPIILCLGCAGFYSGLTFGILLIIGNLFKNSLWIDLVLIAAFMFLPTILRSAGIIGFKTSKKSFRFFSDFCLA